MLGMFKLIFRFLPCPSFVISSLPISKPSPPSIREAVLTGTGSYEIEPPTMDEMAKRFAAFADQGFPILVAEADGRVLGYAYASYFASGQPIAGLPRIRSYRP